MVQQSTTAPATYTERLIVPWWWWPVALGVATFLAAEVFLGAPTPLAWLPYAVFLAGTATGLVALGRIRVRVADGELIVDDAHIPMRYLAEVNIIDIEAKRALLGPLATRYAFVIQRPWIREAVRVAIDDPADPTPYWLISTRHPAALAAAIAQGRTDAAGSPAAETARPPAGESIDAAQPPGTEITGAAWPASGSATGAQPR